MFEIFIQTKISNQVERRRRKKKPQKKTTKKNQIKPT